MFYGWLKMQYSSDEVTIPTWKQWAYGAMSKELRYNNKSEYRIKLNTVTTIEIITEENKKKVMGTFIGGTAGLLLLGPLGAIGGLLLGGNKNMVNIAVELNDGRHFVASCTAKTHLALLEFKGKGGTPTALISNDTKECPVCAETVKAKAKICRFCKHKFKFETKKINPPAKTKEVAYDVHFKGLLKAYYEEEAVKVTKSIIGCNVQKARSYILWNKDGFSGIIKGRSLNEAKKFQMKFKELGVKIDYFKNNG